MCGTKKRHCCRLSPRLYLLPVRINHSAIIQVWINSPSDATCGCTHRIGLRYTDNSAVYRRSLCFSQMLRCNTRYKTTRKISSFESMVNVTYLYRESQWPRGLRCRTAATRTLELRVLIPPGTWLSLRICVLSGRGLCDRPITLLEESYQMCLCARVCVCMCVSLSVIGCNYNPLRLNGVCRSQTKKERKKWMNEMCVGSCVCYRYRYLHKGKAIPVEGYYRPTDFQEVEAPRIQDIRYMKVVRLPPPPINITGTYFC